MDKKYKALELNYVFLLLFDSNFRLKIIKIKEKLS